MHEEVTAHAVRQNLRKMLDHISAGGSRLMILRNGEPVAALVPPEELRALEQADGSRMAYHENRAQARLREIEWLKEGLDGARQESQTRRD